MGNASIDKVFKELNGLDKKLRNKIVRKGQRKGAKILASEIKSEAPVESGRTRKSVRVRAGKRKKDTITTVVEVSGGHDEPFIGFVEFGTKDQEPDPFIRRSVQTKKEEVVQAIRDEIQDGIREAMGK